MTRRRHFSRVEYCVKRVPLNHLFLSTYVYRTEPFIITFVGDVNVIPFHSLIIIEDKKFRIFNWEMGSTCVGMIPEKGPEKFLWVPYSTVSPFPFPFPFPFPRVVSYISEFSARLRMLTVVNVMCVCFEILFICYWLYRERSMENGVRLWKGRECVCMVLWMQRIPSLFVN